jgi:uncharacterized protein YqeY
MGLEKRVEQDYKEALRAGDKDRVSTLRMLKAAIIQKTKEKGEEVDEEAILGVLNSAAKQRKEAVEAFQKGGREDLSAKEQRELEIIHQYLPEPLSEEEIAARVEEVITEIGTSSPKDMGKVMKVFMAEAKGRADGGLVNRIVKERLGASQ